MDAERTLVDYLNGLNLSAQAYYDVPSKRPESFIAVERTGGPLTDIVVERPLMDVQCWAKSRRDAALLAESVKSALRVIQYSVPDCFHASITSTFRDTDLESGTPRYHVVTEITFTTK